MQQKLLPTSTVVREAVVNDVRGPNERKPALDLDDKIGWVAVYARSPRLAGTQKPASQEA